MGKIDLSNVLYDKLWYLPTYLSDDRTGKATIFVRRYRIRRTPKNVLLDNTLDVKEFDSDKEMADYIKRNRVRELPKEAEGDNRFVPPHLVKLRDKYRATQLD